MRGNEEFGRDADAVLDILEMTELAWHDCYGEITRPDTVIDVIFAVARQRRPFRKRRRIAVEDYRDLRLAANGIRVKNDGSRR